MPIVTPDAARVADVLRQGGIAVYPTETFYGLGALAFAAPALRRLAAAKLRPGGKPLPLIAADLATAFSLWSEVRPDARVLAERFWPGPLTLVSAARAGLPLEVAGQGTVGVRVPASAAARELALLAGGPLVSTSANLSGGAPVTRVEDLAAEILAAVDAVLDGGPTPGGLPSTVVQVDGPRIALVRPGAVPWPDVLAAAAAAALPSAGD